MMPFIWGTEPFPTKEILSALFLWAAMFPCTLQPNEEKSIAESGEATTTEGIMARRFV